MKFMYIMATSFTKLRLFCYKVFFIIKTLFLPLYEMLYASCMKRFAEVSELFMHAVLELVIHKMASSQRILQGAKKMAVGVC